uniref:Calcium channel flower n=1 Tax=Panagrellus redivivus TaxID=6233 RepID=A0A7E4UQY2_PANRE
MQGNNNPSASRGAPAMTESGYIYINRYSWCKYLSYIRTGFGIVTLFIVWSAAIDALFGITSAPLGVYLLVIGIPVFLLEFGKIIRLCCGTNGSLCQVFSIVLDFDRWRRGLFYCVLAVVCFLPSVSTAYGKVAGCFLFACGVLYVGKCFQKKKIPTYIPDPSQITSSPLPGSSTSAGF